MASQQGETKMNKDIDTMQPKSKELVSNKRKLKIIDIFTPVVCTDKVELEIQYIDRNTKETLRKKLAHRLEGSCCSHGYVKPDSLNIINFSAGILYLFFRD